MLFDSHTHVQFPEFDADRDAVVKRALEAGIWMVNVGTSIESSKKAVELAHKYKEGIYATVGIHPVRDEISNGASPHDAEAKYDFAKIEELARDSRVVGIGETGLDYYRSQEVKSQKSKVESDKERQKELFVKHIELAQKVGKPLIIHCRDAHDDLLKILQTQYGEVQPPTTNNFLSSGCHTATNSSEVRESQRAEVEPRSAGGGRTSQAEVEPRGVMHFFGGEGAWENLDEYLKMGFYISLAGVITFKNYKDIEKVKKIPLDRILIETDAPYAAPEPYRGKRNEPFYVKFVAGKLAEVKGVSFEEITEQTMQNTRNLFGI